MTDLEEATQEEVEQAIEQLEEETMIGTLERKANREEQ